MMRIEVFLEGALKGGVFQRRARKQGVPIGESAIPAAESRDFPDGGDNSPGGRKYFPFFRHINQLSFRCSPSL